MAVIDIVEQNVDVGVVELGQGISGLAIDILSCSVVVFELPEKGTGPVIGGRLVL
jgi:hypothetical protein